MDSSRETWDCCWEAKNRRMICDHRFTPRRDFSAPLEDKRLESSCFYIRRHGDLPLERGLKTTSGKDETINSHKIHTGGWGFIFTRGAWHHHHLLSDMVYAFIHAAMIKQLNVENRSLVKVMKQKSYFKFYGFKEKKGGGGKDLSMLDTPLNTTLWIFAEQLSEACEVCLFLEAFFPSTPFSYACTRQRRPFTHHIVTTWRKSMHKASEPRPFQGKEERKIKCTLAANLTHFSHTHFSADEHCVS